MATRRLAVLVCAGCAAGLVAVLGLRHDRIRDWWVRSNLEDDASYLLTLIEEDGEKWNLKRLERVMGMERAHGMVGDVWFDGVSRHHPGAAGDLDLLRTARRTMNRFKVRFYYDFQPREVAWESLDPESRRSLDRWRAFQDWLFASAGEDRERIVDLDFSACRDPVIRALRASLRWRPQISEALVTLSTTPEAGLTESPGAIRSGSE